MTIREWRNSFTSINRIPLDVLSPIPIHLPHHDRFRASFVCRHWRRTFLQRTELWSELFLSKDEVYVQTLLGRAKRCPLDVTVNWWVPVSTTRLLSPHMKQLRSLDVTGWDNIQTLSELDSEPLPLLHALTIKTTRSDLYGLPPPPSLLTNAVNLKVLRFHSESRWSPFLYHFVFPNLVSFDLSATPSQEFSASKLLDFLEVSPMLQTVHTKITAHISPGDTPEGRVVILPNVKEFNLIVDDGDHGYWLATSISCPSASRTTLTQNNGARNMLPETFFPDSNQWNAIVRQYTRSPAEEVVLESTVASNITCTLTFRSPDNTVVKLCFADTPDVDIYDEEVDVHTDAFHQAAQKIRDHPQANIKRLHISHDFQPREFPAVACTIMGLFQSLGPLDDLTIYCCDIRPFFHSFLDIRDGYPREPVAFPRIKELTIRHPMSSEEVWRARSLASV